MVNQPAILFGESLTESLQTIADGKARVLGRVQAHDICSRFRHLIPPIKPLTPGETDDRRHNLSKIILR